MNEKIDQKIKLILFNLEEAHKESEKYLGKQLKEDEVVVPTDFFDMALAYDKENKFLIEFELALGEKYPNRFSEDQINYWKKEKERLENLLLFWEKRQFPESI